MATQVSVLQNPRLKAMVIPREHGAWGMLLVPLAAGAIVASAYRVDAVSLSYFVLAAFALFWMRTPAEAWLGTTPIKAQSQSERSAVLRTSLVLALLAASAIAALFYRGRARGLLLIGAVSAAAFALQALVKRPGRSGRMPAQIIGAIVLTSTAAGAFYVATGKLDRTALSLWLANWMFAGDQVHFVQVRIRGSRLNSLSGKLGHARGFFAGQILLLIAIVALTFVGFFPKLTLVAFAPVLVRGLWWFFKKAQPLDVHRLGFAELAQALVFGALLCVGYIV